MNKNIFLEKPIETESQDLFEIISYVELLQESINGGAKFIAIDGEHGSGKSSVINILENKENNKRKKSTFININFLNINEKEAKDYHRYFVNQVASDLCDNPFEIEKIFYHTHISYSVSNPSQNKIWMLIIDKILLVLTSFMAIYLAYTTLFKNVEMFQFIFSYSNIYVPIILLIMFSLVIIYGYGIYKPNKTEQSPMLETDKCRINFCKIVSTKVKRNMIFKRKEKTRLYLIIDDLDRIGNEELQVSIISLLYNEYYPLKINGIDLVFIFMLDTHKIINALDKNELSSDKLFDYILPISNNQKHIIRHLTNKLINENIILNDIFNNKKISNKEYLINLICKNYITIRKIKHFFNKLIAKYKYLKAKKIENINYAEMIIVCLLLDKVSTSTLDLAISNIINNESLSDDAKCIENILNETQEKKIFDGNYYIYLYNFIDINDMLNHAETELYLIAEKGYNNTTIDEDNKIIDYLENEKVRYEKVYHEIFLFLDNDTKLIFIGSKKFCDYINKTGKIFDDIDITNAYKNNYGYYLCEHLKLTKNQKEAMILELNDLQETYKMSKSSQNFSKLKDGFVNFLRKMDSNIVNFSLNDYFSSIPIDDEIYELIFKHIKYKKVYIGFKLLDANVIDCDYIKDYINTSFIDRINQLEEFTKTSLKNKILNNNHTSFDVLLKIISEKNTKYDNIDSIFERINTMSMFIPFEKLVLILDNYGYTSKLDKHIIQCLKIDTSKMVNIINRNKYNLSEELIRNLDSMTILNQYNEYYEEMFFNNGFYMLYILSRILNTKKIDYNPKYKDNEEYMNSILDNYKNIKNWASNYHFTKNYAKYIINNIDFTSMDFSIDNYWKIINLIPHLNLEEIEIILTALNNKNELEDFFDYCSSQGEKINIDFVKYLRGYAEEHNMSRRIKTKLTKGINKIEKKLNK